MPQLALIFAAASTLVACGGEDRGRPSGAPLPPIEPADQCALEQRYELQHIVTFEQPFAAASPCDDAIPCPGSPLYFNYDKTHSVSASGEPPMPTAICPNRSAPQAAPDGNAVTPSLIPEGPRCGSESALHVLTSNIATCYGDNGRIGWGGSFDITLSSDYFDASEWDGISLWARGSGSIERSAFVLTAIDEPNLGLDLDPADELGCNCREEPVEDDPSDTKIHCYSDPQPTPGVPSPISDEQKCDAFGAAVAMTNEWRFVAIPFSEMRQKGFGFVSKTGRIDSARLKRLQVLITAGDWDFWIDDFAFFRVAR